MSSVPPAKKAKIAAGSQDVDKILEQLSASRLAAAPSVTEFKFHPKRVQKLAGNEGHLRREAKAVGYYMHRDMRVQDNWAMLYAQKLALENGLPLKVVAMVADKHPKDVGVTARSMNMILGSLREVAEELKELNISFYLLVEQQTENPGHCICKWMTERNVGCLITDFSPLRPHCRIVEQIVQKLENNGEDGLCVYRVDAHNIVPLNVASDKQEYAARTIRKKIMGKLEEFLTEFPPVTPHPHGKAEIAIADWDAVSKSLTMDIAVKPVGWARPGTRAGLETLALFVERRLKRYNQHRNDPNADALSNLSPWFHLGAVSVQRAVLHVKKHGKSHNESVAGFVEEAVVRRELSDNFCFYNKNYDNIKGASDWAQKTLNDHRKDKREYLYTRKQLEDGRTHDEIWNAAQTQLTREGKIHGFIRMYWAKKILEWTESPEVALETALYLNDHYSLDGCDPNGFVGCMWSICGIHDQGWTERSIFGKIRFMNYAGCKRKFDISKFAAKYGAKAFRYEKDQK